MRRMRQGNKAAALVALLALVFCLLLGNTSVLAVSESADVSIPVSCTGAKCTAVLLNSEENEIGRLDLTPGVTSYFNVKCESLDKHQFTIKLDNTDTAGVIYDKTVFKVTVTLYRGDDEQIKYVIEADPTGVISGENGKPTQIVFKNTTPSASSCSDDPPVVKHISGKPPKNDVFTFVLTPDNPAYPMPAGSVNGVKKLTITGAGMGEFGDIVFTAPGRYTYTVTEENGSIAGYTYDKSVYTLTYDVTEQGGRLVSVRTIVKDGKVVTGFNAISFTNVYKDKRTPRTGDDSNLPLWQNMAYASLGFMVLIGIMLAITVRKNRKDKPDGQDMQ